MSMLEQRIGDRLKADGPVAALVGARIYGDKLPQNVTYPAVSFQRITDEPEYTLSGATTLENAQIQIDCWAATFDAAWDVAEAVKDSMQGSSTNFRVGSHTARSILEPEPDIYHVAVEFSCWHSEA